MPEEERPLADNKSEVGSNVEAGAGGPSAIEPAMPSQSGHGTSVHPERSQPTSADPSQYQRKYRNLRWLASLGMWLVWAMALGLFGYTWYWGNTGIRPMVIQQDQKIRDLEQLVNDLGTNQTRVNSEIRTLSLNMADIRLADEKRISQIQQLVNTVDSSLKKQIEQTGQLAQRQDQLADQFQSLRIETDEKNSQITARDAGLHKEFDALAASIGMLRDQLQDSTRNWTLYEVEHLLVLANQRVQLAGDVEGAITALQIAEQQLGQIEGNEYSSVEESIRTEVTALKNSHQLDLEGISLIITDLSQQLEDLAMRGVTSVSGPSGRMESDSEITQETVTKDKPVREWLGSVGREFLSDLGELVQIEKHGEPIMPPLSPEIRRMIEERGKLFLEGAQIAMMRRDTGAFQERLDAAENWIRERYDDSDQKTVEWLQRLAHLRTLYPETAIPNISTSLETLRSLMSTGG